jgi:TetR/AcrR family transcriptional regulator, tetracycline repressor protein
MPRPESLDLSADDIVSAAVAILHESGLDAVSMRSVSARLGVSPIPLYSRIGNKEALLDAVADRLLAELAPTAGADEPWTAYALRWAHELRSKLRTAPSRLILEGRRGAYVEASRPLIDGLRAGGLSPDRAVQACRLLMWAVVGFVAVEQGHERPAVASRAPRTTLLGADPAGVTQDEVDALFDLHLRILVDGLEAGADV